jgi:hypothetical protein
MTRVAIVEGLRLPGNSRSISKAILDKWVSDSSAHIIPVGLLPIFCAVVGDGLPIQILARPLELALISKQEAKILEWARAELERRKIEKRVQKLTEEIEI